MKLCYFYQLFLAAIALAYTWPDPAIDEIESLIFDPSAFLASGVSSCDQPAFRSDPGSGRKNAQEWVRAAYHDMATADVQAGTGGMDASIAFEAPLNRSENVGSGIPASLQFFQIAQSPKISMADIIALGALQAVQSCSGGKIVLPFRAGRVNAQSAGPPGVPEPHQDLDSHTKAFARQNFTVSEMIAIVACGHTLGGVHGIDFPEIVPKRSNGTNNTENIQTFDSTGAAYDNNIAKEFVANSTQNVLAFGPNVTTRSDFRIFTADGGKMIKQMAVSTDFFYSTCSTVLEKMINTVPKNVILTEPLTPIPVKPVARSSDINLLSDGTMRVSGEIRVLEKGPRSTTRNVTIRFKPRNTASCNGTKEPCGFAQSDLPARPAGINGPLPGNPDFTLYTYNISVPISQGLSSFVLDMEDGGSSKTENNGGGGFPVNDLIVVQTGNIRHSDGRPIASCITNIRTDGNGSVNKTIRIQAAILDGAKLTDITLVGHVPRGDWNSPAYSWREIKTEMSKAGSLDGTGYSIYFGSLSLPWNDGPLDDQPASSFEVVGQMSGQEVRTEFNFWEELPSCGSNRTSSSFGS